MKTLSFTPSDPGSLVLIEERQGMHGGDVTFVRVDLSTMRRMQDVFVLSKKTDGRLRTSDPGLQTQGEGLMIPKNMSRFSIAKAAAGTYAMTQFSFSMLTYEGFSCVKSGTPVFRFKPGVANLITAEMLPSGGGSNTFWKFSAARNGSNNDIPDAQKVLNEYPNLRTTIVPAELVGFVKFRDAKSRVTGCGKGDDLVIAE